MFSYQKYFHYFDRHIAARLLAGGIRNYSKDYSSSDDEKDHKKSKVKKEKKEKPLVQQEAKHEDESASAKLNRLLASMPTADDMVFGKRVDIVAKPGEGNKKKKLQKKQELESKDIFAAAKNVAAMLGDEKQQQQQTESELLSRLLGGKSNQTPTSEEQSTKNEAEISLSELIVGMKIDRRQQQKDTVTSRSEFVRRSLAGKGKQQQKGKIQQEFGNDRQQRTAQRKREAELFTGSVNLFGSKPLDIFTDATQLQDSADLLPTWSYLQEQSLKLQVAHPPANYFDKLATWTEQGKIWRFPINNEQDWLEEKDVDFSEHIFLEQHLEDWCPSRGPVRHFMELVCVGLSKNPYITAKDKKDHIMWYREYFQSKKDILRELMDKDPKQAKKSAGAGEQQKQVEA